MWRVGELFTFPWWSCLGGGRLGSIGRLQAVIPRQLAKDVAKEGRQLESPWLPNVERSERQLTEGLQFPVACGRRSASLRPAGTVAFIE